MDNSYRFFKNEACKYFPCHKGLKEFNCLFCFCPFYLREDCPGNPKFWNKEGTIIKDCSDCAYPHYPEHYDTMMAWIRESNAARTFSEEIRKAAVPFSKKHPEEEA